MVEGGGLESRCTGNRTVGSNPTLSAIASQTPKNRYLQQINEVNVSRLCRIFIDNVTDSMHLNLITLHEYPH